MITKQERELAKHEIADISYDLSVRDGILGLDQVKDVLRNSQPSDYSTHSIGVDYDNWRLAITHTDRLGHIEINRSQGVVSVDIVIGSHRTQLASAGDRDVHYIADDLGELIRTPLEALAFPWMASRISSLRCFCQTRLLETLGGVTMMSV